MTSRFDHLVVAANTLEEGIDWVEQKLGVAVPAVGKHAQMGTHNALMRVGPDCYFEIIAIDPNADAPDRPRWFALDDEAQRERLAKSPFLATWVINCPDLEVLINSAEFDLGRATPFSRGELNWLFSLPDDGRLFEEGLVPYALQWLLDEDDPRVATRVEDLGCEVMSLDLYHPEPEWLGRILASMRADHLVSVNGTDGEPHLKARFRTPKGDREI